MADTQVGKEDMDALMAVLNKLPKDERNVIEDKNNVRCFCGKYVPITDMETINTGQFITASDICKGCRKGEEEDRTKARFVCAKCHQVIMRIPAHTDPGGFEFKAGHSYHVDRCPICTPGTEKMKIIEKVIYNRKRGIIPPE